MKKLYSTIMMLAALSLTVCGDDGDDDNNGSGSGSKTSLNIVYSNGEKYISLGGLEWASEYNVNGSLTDNASIYCLMTYEKGVSVSYLYINLTNCEKSVSDFPSGYDLGNPTFNFGKYKSS